MKLIPIMVATAGLFAIGLWGQRTSAVATPQGLSPEQAARFSRDLTSYPKFFSEGREEFEREIQRLYQRQNGLTEPPIEINVNPQAERDRLPQLQPGDFPPQSQPQH